MKRFLAMLLAVLLLSLGAVGTLAEADTVTIEGEKVLQMGESEVSFMTFSLDDEAVAEKINKDAEAQAKQVMAMYDLNAVTLKVECLSMSVMGNEVLSVRFAGDVQGEDLPYPSDVYYTTNYSLATGERLTLAQMTSVGPIVRALLGDSDAISFEKEDGEAQEDAYYQEQAAYLKDLGLRELTAILESADIWAQETGPLAHSYWSGNGTCTVSLVVPHALGDYAHITFAYE